MSSHYWSLRLHWLNPHTRPSSLDEQFLPNNSEWQRAEVVFQHFAVAKEAEAKAKSNASSSHALEKLGPGEEGEEEDEEEEAVEEEPAGACTC